MTSTKRIALVHLMQETNTFNPVPTTLADFENVALLEGGRGAREVRSERADRRGARGGRGERRGR